jgi:hypothetical protein
MRVRYCEQASTGIEFEKRESNVGNSVGDGDDGMVMMTIGNRPEPETGRADGDKQEREAEDERRTERGTTKFWKDLAGGRCDV